MTVILPVNTKMRQSQLLKHQVKITSTIQELTQAYLMTPLPEMMIRQMDVTVQIFIITLIQLHLQKYLSLPIKTMVLIKMKPFHVMVKTFYGLTLTQTSQTHTDIRQVSNNQILQ